MLKNAFMDELRNDLRNEYELLAECKTAGDAEGVRTQEKIIRLIERKLEEAMKPTRRELEAKGERYGWDFY